MGERKNDRKRNYGKGVQSMERNRWKNKGIRIVAVGVICGCIVGHGMAFRQPARVSAAQMLASAGTKIPAITLSVGEGQKTPVFEAGSESTLTINLKNTGTVTASHVKISPKMESADSWPFVIEEMNYDRKIDTIPAGEQRQAQWVFHPREDAVSGMYRLDFVMTYDDGENEYQVGKYVYAKVKTNAGENGGSASDNGGTQNGAAQQGDPGMNQNAAQPEEGALHISDEPTGEITVGDTGSVVNEGTGKPEHASVPRVIVTGFTTDPGQVSAGGNFRLVVHVKNTASWTAVSNMLFDFQAPAAGTDAAAEAPAFLPASGSSSVYLDSIPAGETRDVAIELNARADLTQKPYSIVMNVKYEDGQAAGFDGSASLAVPVVQQAKVEFSDVELTPASISLGQEANLTCNLYNTGRRKLYNVKASFQGSGMEAKEIFVGNIDSGGTGAIDAMILGTEESVEENNGKLVITYEDETGKQSTLEKGFSLPVTAMAEPVMTDMPQEQQSGLPIAPIIAALAAIAVVAAAVIIILKKRKKKKARREEDALFDEVDRFIEDEHTKP